MENNNNGELPCSPRQANILDSELIKENIDTFFDILGKIGMAVYLVDPITYKIIAANNIAEKFLGPNPLGKKCYELLLKKRKSPCEECVNSQIAQGNMDIQPLPLEFKSDERWYRSVSKVIKYGEFGNLKVEIISDITENKLIEKELNELKVFKEKVENLPHVPVFTFGRRGRIKTMNHAALTLLGYEPEDIGILHIWHIIDDQAREKIYNLIEQFSNSDRQSFSCSIIGKEKRFDAHLDILLHRDIKGIFLEGTAFIVEKQKKVMRFY